MAGATNAQGSWKLQAVLQACPASTVEALMPSLITRHGPIVQAEPLTQELPRIDGVSEHRCDVALRCRFADGQAVIVVLVEDWGQRDDLDRAVGYAAALRMRHPSCEVVPALFATKPKVARRADRWVEGDLFMEVFLDMVAVVPSQPDAAPCEHWSWLQRIDCDLVAWQVATVRMQYPDCDVVPILFAADAGMEQAPDRSHASVSQVRMSIRVLLLRLKDEDVPRLRALRHRVAAVLVALAGQRNAEEGVWQALVAMAEAGLGADELRRCVPLVMELAKLKPEQAPALWQRLRKDAAMVNAYEAFINELKAEGRTEGRRAGEIQARCELERAIVAAICRLVERRVLSHEQARMGIQELRATGALSDDVAAEALAGLGCAHGGDISAAPSS